MVGRLGEAATESHVAARIVKTLRNRVFKLMSCHMMRAREGDQCAIFRKQLRCAGMQIPVPSEGITDFSARLREGRRVENDDVVFGAIRIS